MTENILTHLGTAGACAASGASSSPGAARGLRPPNRDSPGDPATRAAGVLATRYKSMYRWLPGGYMGQMNRTKKKARY